MKTFATIEFFALLICVLALWNDRSHWNNIQEEGWITHYTISRKVRKLTTSALYGAGVLSIVGVLIAIWTL